MKRGVLAIAGGVEPSSSGCCLAVLQREGDLEIGMTAGLWSRGHEAEGPDRHIGRAPSAKPSPSRARAARAPIVTHRLIVHLPPCCAARLEPRYVCPSGAFAASSCGAFACALGVARVAPGAERGGGPPSQRRRRRDGLGRGTHRPPRRAPAAARRGNRRWSARHRTSAVAPFRSWPTSVSRWLK